ncbi:MAG: glutamate racemase [Flavobacteriales bacterium]|nr:glutamate racemase [Flavobacteriales bacterium]
MAETIGVFDSGIGGLTVASAIKHRFPNVPVVYFGDTAHLPYGDKSAQNIKKYTEAIASFLFEQNCNRFVVACNSASSILDMVKKMPAFDSVVNVIDPMVEYVANQKLKRVGVIGTKRTIYSGVYGKLIALKSPKTEVYQIATPLLAPMIEEGFITGSVTRHVIDQYLGQFPDMDALILGCTHYPLIKTEIDHYFRGKVKLLDAPELVANSLAAQLDIRADSHKEDHFFVSDYTSSFEQTARLFFGEKVKLEKIDIFG